MPRERCKANCSGDNVLPRNDMSIRAVVLYGVCDERSEEQVTGEHLIHRYAVDEVYGRQRSFLHYKSKI